MATYTWPSTGRHRPEDPVEHATRLKTDFDSVSNTANASLSNTTLLPAGLESRISKGITKGIAEARSNGFCPKWSEIDKSIFSKVMLKNISNEAALEARDRIPLPQFNGLHESYNALHTKIVIQMPPTTTTHHFVDAGAAIEATSVVDLVHAAKKTSGETDRANISKEMVTSRQEEKNKAVTDEESGNDTGEEDDSEMDESEDAESDQEVMESENVSGDDSGEPDSSDDDSGSEVGSEEDSETDDDTSCDEEESQEIVREESVPFIQEVENGFSTSVNLRIEHQASVNRLVDMECLSSSIRKFLCEQHLSPPSLRISSTSLLVNGDIKVLMHAKTRGALRRILNSTSWDQRYESTLIGSPIPTYKVRMHNVNVNSLTFQNRTEKSMIIRQLADANRAISQVSGVKPIIRDIRWSQYSLPKETASLVVEFLDPKQATQALVHGLCWQQRRHGCDGLDPKHRLLRCIRCQDYGHLFEKCSAPHRCRKCAEPHSTSTCQSNKVKCAFCGGGHYAGKNQCPAKAKARRSVGFLDEAASQAIEPTAEAQATPAHVRPSNSVARTQTETSMPSPVSLDASAEEEIKSESESKSKSDQSLSEADPTRDTHPDTATLLEKIEALRKETEDIRKIVVARDDALQTTSSGRTKRRAGEAFADGAEAESSNTATKRIKQEQPTRKGSMGLYRQPSPFIVNRPQ